MAKTIKSQSIDSNGLITVTFADGSEVSGRPLSTQEMFQLFVEVAREDGPEALREIMTAFYQMRNRINEAQNQALFEAEQVLDTSENKEVSQYLRAKRTAANAAKWVSSLEEYSRYVLEVVVDDDPIVADIFKSLAELFNVANADCRAAQVSLNAFDHLVTLIPIKTLLDGAGLAKTIALNAVDVFGTAASTFDHLMDKEYGQAAVGLCKGAFLGSVACKLGDLSVLQSGGALAGVAKVAAKACMVASSFTAGWWIGRKISNWIDSLEDIEGHPLDKLAFDPKGWRISMGTGGSELIRTHDNIQSFIIGMGGEDILIGGRKDDNIYGGDDDDTLEGGGGYNYLVGGKGRDKYIIGQGFDTIQDSDNDGEIEVYNPEGRSFSLSGGGRNAKLPDDPNCYLDDNGNYYYKFRPYQDNGTLGDLHIYTAQGQRIAKVVGYDKDSGSLGITLRDGEPTPEDIPYNLNVTGLTHNQVYAQNNPAGHTLRINTGGSGGIYHDSVFGGAGNEIVKLGAGHDRAETGLGNDRVYGEAGYDIIFAGPTSGTEADAENDRDYVIGGSESDLISTGIGDDVIVCGETNFESGSTADKGDWALGGAGRDVIYGSRDRDFLNGGAGDDLIYGGGGDDVILGDGDMGFTWKPRTLPTETFAPDNTPIVKGRTWHLNNKDETFAQENVASVVVIDPSSRRWDAVINHQDGTFTLVDPLGGGNEYQRRAVGGGNDEIYGGEGHDWIAGQTGNDYIDGGEGDDIIYGDDVDAPDYPEYSDNDTLIGGLGSDTIYGGGGNDYLLADAYDYATGKFYYDGAKDYLYGGAGNDILVGGLGAPGENGGDELYGGSGDDNLQAGPGDNFLYGGADNDRLYSGQGSNLLDGGAGINAYYFNRDAMNSAGRDIIRDASGWWSLFFSGDEPKLTGDNMFIAGENVWRKRDDSLILSLSGDDVIIQCYDEEGNPGKLITIEGGRNHDSFAALKLPFLDDNKAPECRRARMEYTGEAGRVLNFTIPADTFTDPDGDTLRYIFSGTLPTWLNFNYDTLTFTGTPSVAGTYEVWMKAYDGKKYSPLLRLVFEVATASTINRITGTEDDDHLLGTPDADYIEGGGSDDELHGDDGHDDLYSDAGNDRLYGGAGDDSLFGGEGNDILEGGAGNDQLYGGDGDDVLDGGAGDDYLEGGRGNDVYVFGKGYGHDVIYDDGSTPNETDSIRLLGLTPEEVEFRAVHFVDCNRDMYDLVIAVKETGETITVKYGLSDHYYDRHHIKSFIFADGTVMNMAEVVKSGIQGTEGDDVLGVPTTYWGLRDYDYFLQGHDGDDLIRGGFGHDTLDGGSGDDQLYGGKGDDVLDGGAGDDYLEGGAGNDTYIFGRGYEHDTINNIGGGNDILKIADIDPAELWFQQSSKHLRINLVGMTDQVTINNWFASGDYKIDTIEAGDYSLIENQAAQLVQAMAGLGAPGGAGGRWTGEQQESLADIVATHWQRK